MGLQVKDVVLELGDGDQKITALDHVSFGIAAGELLAVLGPSGAGKSSLLAVCGGLRHPTSGTVVIGDKELTAMHDSQLTRLRLKSIGFVFQQSNLISSLTSLDQLMLMVHLGGHRPTNADRDHAMSLLRSVDMAHRANRLPDQLSGGERQRIGIARALMTKPSLLLVDEPTSMLDRVRGRQIVELLSEQCHQHQVAAVMVTHDRSMLDAADRSLHIVDGRIQEAAVSATN
jgi:putative ABC transport system ATP-binding protein